MLAMCEMKDLDRNTDTIIRPLMYMYILYLIKCVDKKTLVCDLYWELKLEQALWLIFVVYKKSEYI